MKGPHGLNDIRLYPQFPEGYLVAPFVVSQIIDGIDEGLVTSRLFVHCGTTSKLKAPSETLAKATLVYVEGDDETRDTACAWLLDLCNARYGGA